MIPILGQYKFAHKGLWALCVGLCILITTKYMLQS
jgi:hypothetical protein